MNIPATVRGPHLSELLSLFPTADDFRGFEALAPEEVPSPYRELLVHEHHMTVTVERHHGDLVDVRILARTHKGNSYARKILLTLHGSGRVVQFGIMRIEIGRAHV